MSVAQSMRDAVTPALDCRHGHGDDTRQRWVVGLGFFDMIERDTPGRVRGDAICAVGESVPRSLG